MVSNITFCDVHIAIYYFKSMLLSSVLNIRDKEVDKKSVWPDGFNNESIKMFNFVSVV